MSLVMASCRLPSGAPSITPRVGPTRRHLLRCPNRLFPG